MPPIRRPRTEPIVRVRTGCYTCRRRKKKCNEAKPVCSSCARNKLSCIWPLNLPDDADISTQITTIPTTTSQHSPLTYTSPREDIPLLDLQLTRSFSNTLGSATPTDAISRSLSMLPGQDPDSFELLSHYLVTTADCMANGSTPLNPFLVQIIPLTFASDLLLQLVLTQSAAHRAFRSRMEADEVAVTHYTKALRLFRNGVAEFVHGGQSSSMVLTTGALIMCFTETARGDINGTVFDHLAAANSLLCQLPLHREAGTPGGLHDFLIEYYTYTAAVSMISIDTRVGGQQLLGCEIEQRVSHLLESNYRQWMMRQRDDEEQPTFSADDLVLFGSLQAQISQWTPYASVSHETRMAGLVYKNAVLVYLLTSLGDPTETTGSLRQALVESTVAEALALLRQLPATARINSGLCWPIVVVDSCLKDPEQQDELRCRLTTMGNTFGLGNMYRTLLILEHMWATPHAQTGPWNICRAMQRNQVWISFA